MEITTAGRATVPAKIENLGDVLNVRRGLLTPDQVRAFDVPDALVDTGATILSLPRRYVAQLGLSPFRTRTVRTAAPAVRLTVQGRECTIDVAEVTVPCSSGRFRWSCSTLSWTRKGRD
jgi:hypothetical protein